MKRLIDHEANAAEDSAALIVGIGCLLVMLAALLAGLKLLGLVAWSWWWILAPLWMPVAIFAGLIGVMLVAALIFAAFVSAFT